jgi:hypothetical protein
LGGRFISCCCEFVVVFFVFFVFFVVEFLFVVGCLFID